jgi:hypothetical protein
LIFFFFFFLQNLCQKTLLFLGNKFLKEENYMKRLSLSLMLLVIFYTTTSHAFVQTAIALGQCMKSMVDYYQSHKEDIKAFKQSVSEVTHVTENLVTLATHAYESTTKKLSKISLPISLGSFSNTKQFSNINTKLSELESKIISNDQKLDKLDVKLDVIQSLVESQSKDLNNFYKVMDENQNLLKQTMQDIQNFLALDKIAQFKSAISAIQFKFNNINEAIRNNLVFEEKNTDIEPHRNTLMSIEILVDSLEEYQKKQFEQFNPNSDDFKSKATSIMPFNLEQKNILYLYLALSYQYGKEKTFENHKNATIKYFTKLLQIPTQKEALDQRIKTKEEEIQRLNTSFETNYENKFKIKEIMKDIEKEEETKKQFEEWRDLLKEEHTRIALYREVARNGLSELGMTTTEIQAIENSSEKKSVLKSFELEAAMFLIRKGK